MAQAGTVIETRLKQAGTPAKSEAAAHAAHAHWGTNISLAAAVGLDDQGGKHPQNIKAG